MDRAPDDVRNTVAGMAPEEMHAEAQLSEIRVEALQQLTSALSGSRISLPPDDGAPSQLLWHSPTYGAGQQLLPTGIPANTLPPTAVVDHGRSFKLGQRPPPTDGLVPKRE